MQHRMCFRNVYTDAMLECNYQAGEARICSDSISAIAILKEHMSREAVRLRVIVSVRRQKTLIGLVDS